MPRVRLKVRGTLTEQLRLEISRILCNNDIILTRLHASQDGYIAQVESENDESKIFDEVTKRELQTKDCHPVMSPDKRAKHTLVLKGVDESIMKKDPTEIATEIERTNNHLKVEHVYVMTNVNYVKVRLNTINNANKVKETGLRIFSFSITPRQIEFERFTAINQCMHCYEYTHNKSKCPNKQNKYCSECGETGHTYTECNNSNKKCLRCGGSHRTLANKCPERQKIIKETEVKKNERAIAMENKTYSAVAKAAVNQTLSTTKETIISSLKQSTPMSPQPVIQLPNNTSLEILTVLINAHLTCLKEPGSDYNKVANRGLRRAGLPEVTLESDADSAGILKVIAPPQPHPHISREAASSQESLQSHFQALDQHDRLLSEPEDMEEHEIIASGHTQPQQQQLSYLPPIQPTYLAAKQKSSPQMVRKQTKQKSQTTQAAALPAEQATKTLPDGIPSEPSVLGLRLYAYDIKKYQQSSRKSLGDEIRKGTIKYTYSNPAYHSPEQDMKILKHLRQGDIEVTPGMIEERRNINKVRNGFEETRDRPEESIKKKP